jgi:creatinine amidohydrolase
MSGGDMLLDESVWLHERAWPSIAAYLEKCDIALIPIGATEQHGAHTPLMVDTGWATWISEQVAVRTGVLVAPPLHFGWSPHHLAYAGGITLRPETLKQVIVDVGESLLVHGFRKLVLVNGNRVANLPPMEIAATKLRFSSGALVAVVDIGLIARKEVAAICDSGPGAVDHAADAETSFMLHAYPELVDMARAQEPAARSNTRVFASHIQFDHPLDGNLVLVHATAEEFAERTKPWGTAASARAATRQKGERIVAAVVDNFVAYVEQLRATEAGPVRRPSIPI